MLLIMNVFTVEMYSIFPLEHCYFIDKKLKIKKNSKSDMIYTIEFNRIEY